MHTFKNLVKHKRSSTCFCGTNWGEKRKEKIRKRNIMNVLARCMNVKSDLVQSLETVQLKSLKADLEMWAVRIMLVDLLLTCQGMAESWHCLFTLICQGCMQEYWQKIFPRCTSCLWMLHHATCATAVPLLGPLLMSHPNYGPLQVVLRETLMQCFIFKGQCRPLELKPTSADAFIMCVTHTRMALSHPTSCALHL